MGNFLSMVGDLCLKDSHEKMSYSINPSFVSTKILSSDVRVVFVFILKCLSTRATATRLCPSCHAKLIFPQRPLKSKQHQSWCTHCQYLYLLCFVDIFVLYFWLLLNNWQDWNRRLTNSAIQFAPNYLFRAVLVNIVLFPLFFDFINIFSTFYIFTYLITF